jgi:uncharacterized protein (TIGR02145 family)
MKRLLFIMIAAAMMVFAGCKKDDDKYDPPAQLWVPETISTTAFAGSYPIIVMCDTGWTATLNDGATWCEIFPTAGIGNGTVTVNVATNSATVARMATITFAAGLVNKSVVITQQLNPTLYPASNMTWTFGNQTWSDNIHCLECNDEYFSWRNDTDVYCNSYTWEGKTRYYYTWDFVNTYKTKLCPSPWRVPTYSDFSNLTNSTNNAALLQAWGRGGHMWVNTWYQVGGEWRWSSSEWDNYGFIDPYVATALTYLRDGITASPLAVVPAQKSFLYQVVCVR